MEVFECMSNWEISPRFVEALACDGGCIGGPGIPVQNGTPVKRAKVVNFARQTTDSLLNFTMLPEALSRRADPIHGTQ